MSENAYVGFKGCGCAVAAMSAGVDSERAEKAELKRWVRQGYRIEVMDPATARAQQGFLGCIHKTAGYTPTQADEIDDIVAGARS